MNPLRLPITFSIAASLMWPLAARAQDQLDSNPPAHVAVMEGAATLDREDQSEPLTLSMPIVAGDRLRTENGRAEVLFPDGSALDIDEFSSVELQSPTLLRVTSGRVLLTIARTNDVAALARFQIDTPSASATTEGAGEYRVAVLNGATGTQTELAVVRGSGALTTERGSTPLRAGERSVAWENAAPSYPQPFNSARFDAFDRWASAQRNLRLGSTASAQYLPPDLRMYGGTFDRYGSWAYEAPYGYVWYPSVPLEWRPYYDGYWDAVPRFGWTWIGVNVWSWPTHHYGRWGFSRSHWFWIPDRRWAPAWVYWSAAPGYVGWCPLGFDNRPVFSLSVSIGSRWADGWVVLPRTYFGVRSRDVRRYAVSPRMLPLNTPFVEQASAPIVPPRAVPRRLAESAAASRGYAVPRNQAASPDTRALPGNPGRVAGERRAGAPIAEPSNRPDLFKAPLSGGDSRAMRRRPSAAADSRGVASPSPGGLGATVAPGAVQRSQMRAPQQPNRAAPQAAPNAPVSPAGRTMTPRYAPRAAEPAQAAPAPPPAARAPMAVPRQQPSAGGPAPSARPSGRAESSRSSESGNSKGAAGSRQHAAGSRRPR